VGVPPSDRTALATAVAIIERHLLGDA
jgi:hypothetical protein